MHILHEDALSAQNNFQESQMPVYNLHTPDALTVNSLPSTADYYSGYRFSGAAAPCSEVQGMYKLHAAAFAQCSLLPTLQNVGVKLLATF